MYIDGTFAIQMTAEPPYHDAEGVTLGRFRFTKQFSGPLTATSTVEMLGARTAIDGSAGYAAIELVTGTLDGRSGSFVLQHRGVMDRGASELSVTVVPDSATGALRGLRGAMTIRVETGVHHYGFDYTIADV
jgi:hypothetical protein